MKRFKAITALLLAVLLLCSAAPLNALAAEIETETVGEDYPQLVLGVPYTVDITILMQRPILTFSPAESGVYRFNTSSHRSHYHEIFKENWDRIGYSYGSNNHIDCSLEAGKTYYVKTYYPSDEWTGSITITAEKTPMATEMQLSSGAAQEITLGTSFRITPVFLPDGVGAESVTWTTSKENVVTVEQNGIVRAVGVGTAVITGTSANGLTASCNITVSDYLSLILDTPHTVDITILMQRPILTFSPAESGVYRFNTSSHRSHYHEIFKENWDRIGYSYGSNNHIDCSLEAGKTYYVKTYYPSDEWTGSITITAEKTPMATEMQLSSGTAQEITLGTSFRITPAFLPDGVGAESVTWTTSKDSVVTVEQNGIVRAVGVGTAVITATSENGLTASCRIAVVAAPMRGDADGNGKVDVSDATEIQRYLAEMQVTSDARVLQCGDVTGDNKVNINDVTALQRFLAELEDPYHVGELI